MHSQQQFSQEMKNILIDLKKHVEIYTLMIKAQVQLLDSKFLEGLEKVVLTIKQEVNIFYNDWLIYRQLNIHTNLSNLYFT